LSWTWCIVRGARWRPWPLRTCCNAAL
jgi:hypothetical protein